jgi:hypothetical protein
MKTLAASGKGFRWIGNLYHWQGCRPTIQSVLLYSKPSRSNSMAFKELREMVKGTDG